MAPIPTKFRLRQDTTANWTAINPILQQGEPGWETDSKIMRMGDGVTPFMSLVRFTAVSDITEIEDSVEASVNATFAPLRDDNSGPTAPANPVPGMRWRDTSVTPPVLRVYNAAGTAWQLFVDVLDDYIASLASTNATGVVTRNASGVASLIPANLTPNPDNAMALVRLNAEGTALEYAGPPPTQIQDTWNDGTSEQESLVSPAKVKAAIEALNPAQTAPTTSEVLSATAGATAGGVGTYGLFRFAGDLAFGATTAGSNLRPSNSRSKISGSSPAGTWRCLGFSDIEIRPEDSGPDTVTYSSTLWLRIS